MLHHATEAELRLQDAKVRNNGMRARMSQSCVTGHLQNSARDSVRHWQRREILPPLERLDFHAGIDSIQAGRAETRTNVMTGQRWGTESPLELEMEEAGGKHTRHIKASPDVV